MIQHEYIKIEDFKRVGTTNQYWLWHFTASKDNLDLQIQPIHGKPNEIGIHPFRDLVEQLQIPIFETPTKDAIDFLISLDKYLHIENIIRNNNFSPIVLGFNYMRLVSSTHHPNKCYCCEKIVEIVAEMNVELLGRLKFD
jgi:hypothetical protein